MPENTKGTTQSLQWVRGRKTLETCSSSAAWMGRGSQAARDVRGEDQLSLFGWSGKLAYRPWGDTVWIMLVSHRTKINKPYYNFLGLLYQLVVWSRTPNRYGSFISHDLFPSDMHLQREMLFSSWSKLYKWGQQASHDALILHGLHYTWW